MILYVNMIIMVISRWTSSLTIPISTYLVPRINGSIVAQKGETTALQVLPRRKGDVWWLLVSGFGAAH